MFKVLPTPELVTQISSWGYTHRWLTKGYWLCVDPLDMRVGYIDAHSEYSKKYLTLKELNPGILTQLVLLHSIGFTPKEIAEIINGDSDVPTDTLHTEGNSTT